MTERGGNIFNSNCIVLVNPVNCVGTMGAGLAKAFAKKFPGLEKDYKIACLKREITIGNPMLWMAAPDKYILCLPTKDDWKNPSEMEFVTKGLDWIAERYISLQSIAIPALGCGLGGLEWNDVKKEIEERLGNLPFKELEIYPPK